MKSNLVFLVVDDFEPVRRLIKRQLESWGIKSIYEVTDGKQAHDFLKQNQVDVIISDWNMPNMTGLELLQFVRSEKDLEHIHFMLITAEAERKSIVEAINEGVDDFLIKPFTPGSLKQKVTAMLSRAPRKKVLGALGENLEAVEATTEETLARPADVQPTVVVVDDVPVNIDLVREILIDDYKIKAATTGEKALSLIKSAKPDLILLDIMMPVMDGYEVCSALKLDIETANIPVIFISTKNEVFDMTQGFSLGAVDYITKPFNPDLLKARVKTHVQLKRSRDDMAYEIQSLMEIAKLREDVERITRHDLKNPLAAILNTSEDLLGLGYLHREQVKEIETIRDAASSMLGMINRSLDLFKMETGTYELNAEKVDLAAITLKAVNESRANAHKLGVTISYDAPEKCFVMAEALLCVSILANLIKNAYEASASNATVIVTIKTDETMASLQVHNDGVIPEDIKESFFEKYVTSGKEQGTGLGTYSAKLMANIQNGDLRFDSNEESGTTLTLDLPLAAPD